MLNIMCKVLYLLVRVASLSVLIVEVYSTVQSLAVFADAAVSMRAALSHSLCDIAVLAQLQPH